MANGGQSAIQSGSGVSPLNQGRDGPATLPNPQSALSAVALAKAEIRPPSPSLRRVNNPQSSHGSTESRPAIPRLPITDALPFTLHPLVVPLLLALCFCLSASAIPAAVVANAAAAPPASGDLLQFLDGSVLHGSLQSVDSSRGLRWQHPVAKAPFDLMPAHVDFVRFPQARPQALTPTCHIRFAGGDDLFGSLISMDEQTMQFSTWFGGTMKIPRAAIQTITFLPRNYAIVYEGPSDASEWTTTPARQNIRLGGGVNGRMINGNIIIMGGGQLVLGGNTVSSPGPGPQNWTYRDGAFATVGAAVMGRDFGLTGSSTIEFDVACDGNFSLVLGLYSASLDRVESLNYLGVRGATTVNNNSLAVQLDSTQVALLRPGRGWDPVSQHNGTVTNFDTHGRPARVTLHCNKDEGSLIVLVDGVEVRHWTDIGDFSDFGTGFVVQNQPTGSSVKLSHFKISKWAGRFEPAASPASPTQADLLSFINRDQAGGKVQGISDGKLDVNLDGNLLHVPCERVRQIDFARSSAVAEPRGPWEVRAIFPGGGSVSFQLEKWDDTSIAGHSALFGDVAFQPGSIRQMEFNLDRPRTGPTAATPENEFDALDQ